MKTKKKFPINKEQLLNMMKLETYLDAQIHKEIWIVSTFDSFSIDNSSQKQIKDTFIEWRDVLSKILRLGIDTQLIEPIDYSKE